MQHIFMPKNMKTVQIEKDIVRHVDTITQASGNLNKFVEMFNPTLESILKVEDMFKKEIEFDSKIQLLRKMGDSIEEPVLDAILMRLVTDNSIMINKDSTLTWICVDGDKDQAKIWEDAIPM